MNWLAKQTPLLLAQWPGSTHRVLDHGSVLFSVPGVKLDAGKWNAEAATVLIVTPPGFPWTPPENFWTEGRLALIHGGLPALTATDSPRWAAGRTLTKCFNRALLWSRDQDTVSTAVRMCQRWFARRVDGHEFAS